MQEHRQPDPNPRPEHLPEDIALGEAGRNWVNRRRASEPHGEVRRLAADAFVTAAIAGAYGTDW